MQQTSDYIIYTDGGSRGNPGRAAYGFVIYDKKKRVLFKEGKTIGITTNNVAEYTGVVEALKWIVHNVKEKNATIAFYLDSELVARQLSGHYKVKNVNLQNLYRVIKRLEEQLQFHITYSAIRREFNKDADLLVNQALDHII